ncbi:hypothetical protein [Glaciibacter flavus]|uniref:hypothetical protein n=1 Tax=Orlajensenia flava TaxID=2565934 RepID=UPI003B001EC1
MDRPLPSSERLLARDATSLGTHDALLTAARHGSIVPLRRGVYIAAQTLELSGPAERHRALALAVGHQRVAPVFAGFTAAVLWGLPVVGATPTEVFLLSPSTSGRRRGGVVEFARTRRIDLVQSDGFTLTSLPDTLIDVARTMPHLTALVMLDAALHRDRFSTDEPLTTIDELRERFAARLPFPGSRKVAALLDMATEDADSPLETLSRWRARELGFPEPELQRRVWIPSLGMYVYLDLAWPEFGVWGEADGAGKYLGAFSADGQDRLAADVVLDEKRRENAVRRTTRWNCARWGWPEAWNPPAFRSILLEAGLPILGRRPR